ncbi:MAG: hypothetical protein H7Z42_17800 [Roseiflexaceae bacterium]|nr:hypothetical protein [Roseiflexaceae bacterium]
MYTALDNTSTADLPAGTFLLARTGGTARNVKTLMIIQQVGSVIFLMFGLVWLCPTLIVGVALFSTPFQAVMLVIFAACALVSAGEIWLGGRSLYRMHRIRTAGRMLLGQIVSCSASTDSDGDLVLNVSYRFQEPDGRELTGKTSHARSDLSRADMPLPGTPVAVLYADPHNHTLL